MELTSDSDTFCRDELGARIVRLHFYGFLEAMIPYFPPGYEQRLREICEQEMKELREQIMEEDDKEFGELVERYWGDDGSF